MGLVQRDGIHRLRHAKKYSGFHSTICVNASYTGFAAGTGRIAGPDPREMAKSDLIVIWGTNPVNTQVNVMTHATRARKERGAKIVAVDVYMNGTMEQADLAGDGEARHRRRAGLRGDALPVPRRQGGLGLSRQIHRRAARAGSACAHARSAMGVGDHRLPGRDHRGVRPARRRDQARLFPAGLRLLALAQRPGQHARGKLHPGDHRRLAARGRRRVPQQRRHLSLGQVDDRRPRRARQVGPHARPVARRRDPHAATATR